MEKFVKTTTYYNYELDFNYRNYCKTKNLNLFFVKENFINAFNSLKHHEYTNPFLNIYEIQLDDKEAFGYIKISFLFSNKKNYQNNKKFINSYLYYILEFLIESKNTAEYGSNLANFILKYKLEFCLKMSKETIQVNYPP